MTLKQGARRTRTRNSSCCGSMCVAWIVGTLNLLVLPALPRPGCRLFLIIEGLPLAGTMLSASSPAQRRVCAVRSRTSCIRRSRVFAPKRTQCCGKISKAGGISFAGASRIAPAKSKMPLWLMYRRTEPVCEHHAAPEQVRIAHFLCDASSDTLCCKTMRV